MSDANLKRGYQIFDRLKADLLKNHESDMIFIDCLTGEYVVQGKDETRAAAEARLLDQNPDAEVFMEQILNFNIHGLSCATLGSTANQLLPADLETSAKLSRICS